MRARDHQNQVKEYSFFDEIEIYRKNSLFCFQKIIVFIKKQIVFKLRKTLINLTKKQLKLFNFSLKINGFPIAKTKHDLDKIVRFSEDENLKFIENQKTAILDFNLKNNPFCKNIVHTNRSGSWENLPILTKKNF
jgi:hypothetical protein